MMEIRVLRARARKKKNLLMKAVKEVKIIRTIIVKTVASL